MRLKDHYSTLQISPSATQQEVKKAYRLLAHKYHPDKNPDSLFATSHFREIQEAYSILSDEKKRRLYDEERYFSGLSKQKEPKLQGARWLLQQSDQLRKHMMKVDSFSMNHRALQEYVLLFLSDSHLALLEQDEHREISLQIAENLLSAVRNIDYVYLPTIQERMLLLVQGDPNLSTGIAELIQQRKNASTLQKLTPAIIVICTILLCILMYLYAQRTH